MLQKNTLQGIEISRKVKLGACRFISISGKEDSPIAQYPHASILFHMEGITTCMKRPLFSSKIVYEYFCNARSGNPSAAIMQELKKIQNLIWQRWGEQRNSGGGRLKWKESRKVNGKEWRKYILWINNCPKTVFQKSELRASMDRVSGRCGFLESMFCVSCKILLVLPLVSSVLDRRVPRIRLLESLR